MPPTGYPMTLLPGRGHPAPPHPRQPRGRRRPARRRRRGPSAWSGGCAPRWSSRWAATRAWPWASPRSCGACRSWSPSRTSCPGAANRLLGRFAKASAVSFPGTDLPRAVVTGNPIRAEITALDPDRDRAAAKRAFGVDAGPAARPRGRRARSAPCGSTRPPWRRCRVWRDRADLAVHHVVGRRDWDAISAARRSRRRRPRAARSCPTRTTCRRRSPPPTWRCAGRGRAPASSWPPPGLPAVLVPSPYVTADQQTGNARHLVDAGAAVLVPDAELDGARLVAEVDAHPRRRRSAWRRWPPRPARWARPDAAADIAALAAEHARG